MSGLFGARLVYGAALLFAPGSVLRLVCGGADGSAAARTVVRILGARHAAQAFVLDRGGGGRALMGAGVDLLHALSMVVVAVSGRDHRRAAVLDAALALGLAAVGLRGALYG